MILLLILKVMMVNSELIPITNQYGFLVSLHADRFAGVICAGGLINRLHGISCLSCFESGNIDTSQKFTVMGGYDVVTDESSLEKVEIHKVVKYHPHPKWKNDTVLLEYNVFIFSLEGPFMFKSIVPISNYLTGETDIAQSLKSGDTLCAIIGWNKDLKKEIKREKVIKTVRIVKDEECWKEICQEDKSDYCKNKTTEYLICAGSDSVDLDNCNMDKSGFMQCQGNVVAIMSLIPDCEGYRNRNPLVLIAFDSLEEVTRLFSSSSKIFLKNFLTHFIIFHHIAGDL